MVHSEVYLNKYVVSIAPFSTSVCPDSGAPTGFFFQGRAIGGGRGQWLGGHHGECGARAYNGGLG